MEFNLNKSNSLRGEITIPPDKSMSHRAVMFNSLAAGKAKISNFLMGEDCLSTISVLKKLGSQINIDNKGNVITDGKGMNTLEEPNQILNVGNSGTTIRLMSGVLAGRKFKSVLDGDESIRRRPMGRVVKPLSMMGAIIKAKNNNENAPIEFMGGELMNISYDMPVASAQLKSALILAGLRSKDGIVINQPALSRDHTERLLGFMGATIKTEGLKIQVTPSEINAVFVIIPVDISSASYWLVAGCIHQNADLTIKNVGINKTRSGIINVLNRMGAKIKMSNKLDYSGEPVCDINISSTNLKATTISGE